MTTDEYLYDTEETNHTRELAYGRVREPPSPFFSHQQLVLKVATVLASHVEARNLGQVAIAPLDVVLDRNRHLIVQPDVLFVARARLSIIDKQVWGAPDFVVEVLSTVRLSGTNRSPPHIISRTAPARESTTTAASCRFL